MFTRSSQTGRKPEGSGGGRSEGSGWRMVSAVRVVPAGSGQRVAKNDHFRRSGRLFCRPGGHFWQKTGVFPLKTLIPHGPGSIPFGAGWIPGAAVLIPHGMVGLSHRAGFIPDGMVGLPKGAGFIPPRLGWRPKRNGRATGRAGIDPAPSGRQPARAGIDPAENGNSAPCWMVAGRARCPHRAAPGIGEARSNSSTPRSGALRTARPTSLRVANRLTHGGSP
jgi:hypothetical protein